VTTIVQGGKIIETGYGMLTTKGPSVAPTSSGNLAVVSGPCLITSLWLIVTTVFTGTATTLNIGTAAGTTTLANAATLTSLAVGSVVTGTPVPNATSVWNGSAVITVGPVVAATGFLTWIASASNTGQLQAFIGWVPLAIGAQVS
jgi:hypothetical protein